MISIVRNSISVTFDLTCVHRDSMSYNPNIIRVWFVYDLSLRLCNIIYRHVFFAYPRVRRWKTRSIKQVPVRTRSIVELKNPSLKKKITKLLQSKIYAAAVRYGRFGRWGSRQRESPNRDNDARDIVARCERSIIIHIHILL